MAGQARLRVYSSDQVHTSIDRAIWVSGIGEENLVRIPVAGRFRAMDTAALEAAIVADREDDALVRRQPGGIRRRRRGAGADVISRRPLCGGDGLICMSRPCRSAMICPEYWHFWAGVELGGLHRLQPA
jgi:aromatic-L-amino-acid decarboxylase